MEIWIRDFKKELSKHFYVAEVDDIASFYEEMIAERLTQGETIEDILSDYDMKTIIKQITPETISKRKLDSYQVTMKSMKQLIIILLTTPFWIPIGVLYITLIIVMGSLLISSVAVGFAAVVGSASLILQGLFTNESWLLTLSLFGLGLIVFSITISVSIWLFKISHQLMMLSISIITKWLAKKGVNHEKTT